MLRTIHGIRRPGMQLLQAILLVEQAACHYALSIHMHHLLPLVLAEHLLYHPRTRTCLHPNLNSPTHTRNGCDDTEPNLEIVLNIISTVARAN